MKSSSVIMWQITEAFVPLNLSVMFLDSEGKNNPDDVISE